MLIIGFCEQFGPDYRTRNAYFPGTSKFKCFARADFFDLVDYLQERFHVMNIKLILIAGTDVYKIQFPSEEMYKLAVAGMLERFFKLIVPV